MSGWPIHRAALRSVNGLRKQLGAMDWGGTDLGVVCKPMVDEIERLVREHRNRLREEMVSSE